MPAQPAQPGGQEGRLSSGAPGDPDQILAILDQALAAPDVTVSRLRFLRHLLDAGREVESFSTGEITQVLDCAERTARTVKQWTRQFFAAMYVHTSDLQKQEENTMHNMDATVELAQVQLEAIGWGLLDGQRVQDPEVLIEAHGALNVLYALWCCRGKPLRNPAGFVTWWLREGHEAPPGWLPVELREKAAPKPAAEPEAAEKPPEELPARPETPEALQPLWEDILAHVEPLIRPSSFHAWIEPLSLLDVEADQTLVLWAPDGFHADWVNTHYGPPLERVVRALGYSGYRFTWPTRKTAGQDA